jgi:predicted transcriptional regulator
MKTKSVGYLVSKDVVSENGVVKSSEREIKRKVNYDTFMKVYLEDLNGLFRLTSGEMKVLMCIWSRAEPKTGKVTLVISDKEEIQQLAQLNNLRSVDNNIQGLRKKNMLVKKGNRQDGTYYINPKYFWNGDELSRITAFKIILSYEIEPDLFSEVRNGIAPEQSE